MEKKDKDKKPAVEKEQSIADFVGSLVESYNKNDIAVETGHIECDFFDSGNYALNYILSGDFDVGFPVGGHMVDVHGDPQTGKSLMVYTAISNFLKKYKDGIAILDDTENAYVQFLGSNIGIDESRFMRFSTSSVEDHAKIFFHGGKIQTGTDAEGKAIHKEVKPLVPELAKKSKHILIVVDSIGIWSTEHELTTGFDKKDMSKPQVLKKLLRTIKEDIRRYNVDYMITNHMYFNIGDMFGPQKKESGGQAPAYQSQIRLCMAIAGKIKVNKSGKVIAKDEDDKDSKIVGVVARATTVKNRFAPPFRSCDIEIRFDSGMSRYSGLLKLLIDLGIVALGDGGWYATFDKKIRFQSKDLPDKWEEIRKLITPDRVKLRSLGIPIIEEVKGADSV